MKVIIESSWKELLMNEFKKPYFKELVSFVKKEYSQKTIYPPGKLIFKAFDNCSFKKIKVVIIGQDPYHGYNQANGLCFSVSDGLKKPPSLLNIFKELRSDLDINIPESGNLERWSHQGVLMLNSILTVEKGEPSSHKNKGWENFTDSVIEIIATQKSNIVFMLWGAYAQKKGEKINRNKHLILESAHPSPFSADRGFFGKKHFSKCNEYLKRYNKGKILW
tara:strand:+ start:478 stop:1140 length:663 start_codon:yes stop_codon:yes gene_type:complete